MKILHIQIGFGLRKVLGHAFLGRTRSLPRQSRTGSVGDAGVEARAPPPASLPEEMLGSALQVSSHSRCSAPTPLPPV